MIENKVLNIGFVGCGSYNSSLAVAAARSSKINAVACWDIADGPASVFSEKHGLEKQSTLEDLLSRKDIQGIIIASPNNAHRENVIAAARAGKHVFVDKPISNRIDDALAMIHAAEEAGVVFAVGHNGRRMPGHRKMKELIEAGEIGLPVTVEANFSHSGGLHLTPQQWRWHREECPALPLMQLGVHFADTIQYLLGDVTEVSSFMTHMVTPADNEDVTVSLLKFRNGMLGYLGSNYASPAVYYVNVYGTKANLHCEGGGNLTIRRAGTDEYEKVSLVGVDTQLEELEDFAECALTGRKIEVDGQAALKALAIVVAALRSNDEKRSVTIEEVISESRVTSLL